MSQEMTDYYRLLEYHMVETDKKFTFIHNRLDKIDNKLDDLNNFKWKIIGFAAAVQVIMTTLATILIKTL